MSAASSWLKAALLAGTLLGLPACSGLPRLVILHDPLTPQEHMTLGESYQAQGKTELAEHEFQAALRQQDDYVPALLALGNLSFEAANFQNAEDSYRKALRAIPGHQAASNNLAMVYLARGDRLDEAERLAKDALSQGGVLRPYILDTLGRIYLRQQRYQEAGAALDEAVSIAPTDNLPLREQLAQSQRELTAATSVRP